MAGATAGLAVFSTTCAPTALGRSLAVHAAAPLLLLLLLALLGFLSRPPAPLPVLGPRQLPQAPGRVGPQVVTGPGGCCGRGRGVSPKAPTSTLMTISAPQGRQVGREQLAATRGAHVEPQPLALGKVVH